MVATSIERPGSNKAGRKERLVRVAFGLGALVVAFIVAFYPSLKWMAGEWGTSSGAMSHGYLVLAISVVLFIREIPRVAGIASHPARWALIVLFGMSATWLLGYVAAVAVVQTVVLPAILLAAIVAAYGVKAARPLAFPVLFFSFALPAWEHLQFIFQAITVVVAGFLIRFADIPALLFGNFVQLSTGTFEISGGCSGLNFIVSGLSLSVLYSHLYYTKISQRVTLIALTLAVAIVGNWMRVFAIIAIGYHTDMQSSLIEDHGTLGWIMFGVLMVPVFFVARRLEGEPAPHTSAKSPSLRDGVVSPRSTTWLAVGAAILAMVAGPLWAFSVGKTNVDAGSLQLNLPTGSVNWTGPDESTWDWSPKFAGPTIERIASYGNETTFVLAYANLYLSQQQGRELVYYSNTIRGHWREAVLESPLEDKAETKDGLRFRQLAARSNSGTWLIWYRYEIDGQFEIDDKRVKIQQALKTLQGKPESGIIAFAAPCMKSCDDARATLADFVDDIGYLIKLNYSRDIK